MLKHGARMDLRGSVGHDGELVQGCLANGQPRQRRSGEPRRAALDLESASGLGRVDDVKRLIARAPRKEVIARSLSRARMAAPTVGLCVGTRRRRRRQRELRRHGDGHTGLHVASFHGQVDAVKVLLKHGANIHAIDKTWNTPPFVGTDRLAAVGAPRAMLEVVAHLVAAGARSHARPYRVDRRNSTRRC